MGTVVCTATHPVDLDDGRELAPGATAEDVDTEHPHNRALIIDGMVTVLDGKVPRVRHDEQRARAAANDDTKSEVRD